MPGGFTIDDFTHDPAASTLTCPAGITRTVSPQRRATFKAACRRCPLREQCTTSAEGRTIVLHEHDLLQRAHRARAQGDEFRETYRTLRPVVERTLSWLTRGNRRVPYRGIAKNDAWFHHRATAVNLKRMLTLGLTSTEGTWALA